MLRLGNAKFGKTRLAEDKKKKLEGRLKSKTRSKQKTCLKEEQGIEHSKKAYFLVILNCCLVILYYIKL